MFDGDVAHGPAGCCECLLTARRNVSVAVGPERIAHDADAQYPCIRDQRARDERFGHEPSVSRVAPERAWRAERRVHAEVAVVGKRSIRDLETDDAAVGRRQSCRASAVTAHAATDEA